VKSYAKHGAFIVNNVFDLMNLKLQDKIALIAQTTRKVEEYMELANYLIPKCKEVRIFNTICNATFENQDAVRELSKKADVMIIIGGKNSSNTKQLASISHDFCADSHHIEDEKDLDFSWFQNKKLCGISAGASTPDWIIQNVIDSIKKNVQ